MEDAGDNWRNIHAGEKTLGAAVPNLATTFSARGAVGEHFFLRISCLDHIPFFAITSRHRANMKKPGRCMSAPSPFARKL